ncbi:MAG: RES family NAD+ phosphorylase [Gemmatimonadales bacterium]|nr:RES family NAD+ phosphorylase [Gemmatimonadales bacterium]
MAESEPVSGRLEVWRAVEAQHVVATMALVDTADEQRVLEEILEAHKPAVPAEASRLHYLLFTPFRYPTSEFGSRFRAPHDPGVFYGADAVRTACAEVGYWRWRFLMASPALPELEPREQTVFQVQLRGPAIDLREPPYLRRQRIWTDPDDYTGCQAMARKARTKGVQIIRYRSVRDPEHGGCAAVLTPAAFARRTPLKLESWYLAVARDRVRWFRGRLSGPGRHFEFLMSASTGFDREPAE